MFKPIQILLRASWKWLIYMWFVVMSQIVVNASFTPNDEGTLHPPPTSSSRFPYSPIDIDTYHFPCYPRVMISTITGAGAGWLLGHLISYFHYTEMSRQTIPVQSDDYNFEFLYMFFGVTVGTLYGLNQHFNQCYRDYEAALRPPPHQGNTETPFSP